MMKWKLFYHHLIYQNPEELRDRAMFELMYACGMRVSEISSLRIRDIDFIEQIVRITGKGISSALFLSMIQRNNCLSPIYIRYVDYGVMAATIMFL